MVPQREAHTQIHLRRENPAALKITRFVKAAISAYMHSVRKLRVGADDLLHDLRVSGGATAQRKQSCGRGHLGPTSERGLVSKGSVDLALDPPPLPGMSQIF